MLSANLLPLLQGNTVLYIKAMNADNKSYQILESNGYLEFKRHEPLTSESHEAVEVIYTYTDSYGESVEGRHWLEGDCFVMNESGVTISSYQFKHRNSDTYIYSKGSVHSGERSNEELEWFTSVANQKKDQ